MNVPIVKYLLNSFWKHCFLLFTKTLSYKILPSHLAVYKNKTDTDHEILIWWDLHTQHDSSWSTLELMFSCRKHYNFEGEFWVAYQPTIVVYFWAKCDNWFSLYTWIYTHIHRYTSIHTHIEKEMWSSQGNSSFCC